MIQLRFIQENNPGGWAVRFWTWSMWSHVEFLYPTGKTLGSRPIKGVQIRPLNYCKPSRSVVGTINCDSATTNIIFCAAESQIGKPYDYLDILGIVTHQDWQEKNAWICSKFVLWACHQGGVDLLDADKLNRVSPRDLAMSPLIRLGDIVSG